MTPKEYSIEIETEDIRLLNLTDIGPYSDCPMTQNSRRRLSTSNKSAFDSWCNTLNEARRAFKIL
jgi:hypothetical protein